MESRIQRIYLDTSVIGGYYDSEFEEDTRILFEKIKLGQFHVVLSDITEGELQEAPEMIRNLFGELSAGSATKFELTESGTTGGYLSCRESSGKNKPGRLLSYRLGQHYPGGYFGELEL